MTEMAPISTLSTTSPSSTVTSLLPLLGPLIALYIGSCNFAISLIFMPLLDALPPSQSTPLQVGIYQKGMWAIVPICVFGILFSFFTAFQYFAAGSLERIALTCSGIGCASVMAWTRTVMWSTNLRLKALGTGSLGVREEADKSLDHVNEVRALLRKWSLMNAVRGTLALAGGLSSLSLLWLGRGA